MSIVWKGGKEAYHMKRAREQYEEADYLHALASVIQQDRPGASYAESMRDALAVDAYVASIIEGRQVGRRTHDFLKQQHALHQSTDYVLMPS